LHEENIVSNDRLTTLLQEYAELEKRMEDPSIHSDQALVRRVGRRYAELAPLYAAHAELEAARADLAAAKELAAEDPAFGSEVEAVAAALPPLEEKLGEMLIPRDPHDAKDVIVEIKAGEGGQESALFAGDLLRMYTRYAERHGWIVEVIDAQDSDLGGVKDVSVAVKTKGVPDGGHGVWSRLKWAACTGCSGFRSPSRRAASTPPPPACSCCPRPRTSTCTSSPATCGSTCSARPAPAASRSTPPTPRCGSPTCPPGPW
jgi:protein subunit release factor A